MNVSYVSVLLIPDVTPCGDDLFQGVAVRRVMSSYKKRMGFRKGPHDSDVLWPWRIWPLH